MAHKALIGGTAYEIIGGRPLVNGTGYDIAKGRTLINGTGHDIPFKGKLGELEEGSIVYLRESGVPVPFYIVCHNYESGLNGSGRTLLLRKDGYDSRVYHSKRTANKAALYSTSDIDTWFNGSYKSVLDTAIQTAIGTTKFQITDFVSSTHSIITIERSVFTPSFHEYGLETTMYSVQKEGTTFPVADAVRVAYNNGSAVEHWTRTAAFDRSTDDRVMGVTTGGQLLYDVVNGTNYSRPCFTLPEDTEVSLSDYLIEG